MLRPRRFIFAVLALLFPISRVQCPGPASAKAGTTSGGLRTPLDFVWQSATTQDANGPQLIPAIAPVAFADLKTMLDERFAAVLDHGVMRKNTGAGIVIGVYDHGERRIFAYGTASPNSIFEIGSITKTFTGLILAQMIEQHRVTLDEPVRRLLPPGTVAKPDGPEITLLDLVTHHSGLPRMPDDFNPTHKRDPYSDYDVAQMYEFLAKHGVGRPEKTVGLYSNIGFGILGQALSVRAGVPYAELVRSEVLGPLQMTDTAIDLPTFQEARVIQGYSLNSLEPRWHLKAFAGAGGLVSTAGDILIYLEAQLHPEKLSVRATAGSPGATLPAAIALTHQPQAVYGKVEIGLAWGCDQEEKHRSCSHDGGTGGYTSSASFTPDQDRAIVVLFNHSAPATGSLFTERVTELVSALLDGTPTHALDD